MHGHAFEPLCKKRLLSPGVSNQPTLRARLFQREPQQLLIPFPFELLRSLDGSLTPYPCGFGAVVGDGFLEPFVLQGFFGRDAFFGVVDEDLAEEVQEGFVEVGSWGDDVLVLY